MKAYTGKPTRMKRMKKRTCKFCKGDGAAAISYKDTELLRNYITEKGKIYPRRNSGCCAKHQRMLASAIKRSRHVGLIPFQAD